MWPDEYDLIDLSLELNEDGNFFPGDSAPQVRGGPFSFVPGAHPEFVYEVELSTQAGTHVQGQHYFVADGKKIDQYPLARFEGPARVVDCRGANRIEVDFLRRALPEDRLDSLMLLFFTGFTAEILARKLARGGLLRLDDLADKPGLTAEGAQFLLERGARFLGIDSVGFEPYPTTDHAINRLLCAHDVLLLENLTRLELVPATGAWLECFPLPLAGVEGTPCRAIVKVPKSR
ncbi:MAG TPA: cyclase family protein [Thermoanaerobaculia bacterium]|nr:cyclase family protein [Thermoanaerobaculia bacterium]